MSKRNKLTQAFIAALEADWQEHGDAIIEKLREDSPTQYALIVAKLCPVQAQVEISEVDLLTEKMEAMTQRERIAFQRGLLDEMEAELNVQERFNDMPIRQRAKLIYEREKQAPQPGSP
jgi:hypothetical protein